jgi:hypothetical protein
MCFAPILRYYEDGWIFELPKYTLSEKTPTVESIDNLISTLDTIDASIVGCTEDNFRVDDEGRIVGFAFNKIVYGRKKCDATKLLKRIKQPLAQ